MLPAQPALSCLPDTREQAGYGLGLVRNWVSLLGALPACIWDGPEPCTLAVALLNMSLPETPALSPEAPAWWLNAAGLEDVNF